MTSPITHEEYLRELNIIKDLGNIISEYTGGECDSYTREAKDCWLKHSGCEQFCLQKNNP